MDVWQHTTVGDSDSVQKLGKLFVIADCKLDVSRHNSGFLFFFFPPTHGTKQSKDEREKTHRFTRL